MSYSQKKRIVKNEEIGHICYSTFCVVDMRFEQRNLNYNWIEEKIDENKNNVKNFEPILLLIIGDNNIPDHESIFDRRMRDPKFCLKLISANSIKMWLTCGRMFVTTSFRLSVLYLIFDLLRKVTKCKNDYDHPKRHASHTDGVSVHTS